MDFAVVVFGNVTKFKDWASARLHYKPAAAGGPDESESSKDRRCGEIEHTSTTVAGGFGWFGKTISIASVPQFQGRDGDVSRAIS